jgi:ABC-type cobalamin/Fe3+-siderophores transport system ATPase subunit
MAMSGSGLNYIIKDLCFSYGSLPCLDDINLTLEPGFLYGLVGPNGSGKSTLLDLMSGHLRLDSGTISLKGKLLDRYSKRNWPSA